MAHTHSDGCKCNKKRVKRKVVRSGKVKMTSPQMARPMNVPHPYVSQQYHFPGNMAPYGSMYNPRVVIDSNRAEASGGLSTRASTNMGTETSHIELRHAETQHSALPPATSFMRPRALALPRPTHAGAQTVTQTGQPSQLFTGAGRPSGSGGGGGSNPFAFAVGHVGEGDVVKTIGQYREA